MSEHKDVSNDLLRGGDYPEQPSAQQHWPTVIFVYRDLNGSLVLCQDVEEIPDRKIGDPIAEYRFDRERRFRIRRELHD